MLVADKSTKICQLYQSLKNKPQIKGKQENKHQGPRAHTHSQSSEPASSGYFCLHWASLALSISSHPKPKWHAMTLFKTTASYIPYHLKSQDQPCSCSAEASAVLCTLPSQCAEDTPPPHAGSCFSGISSQELWLQFHE